MEGHYGGVGGARRNIIKVFVWSVPGLATDKDHAPLLLLKPDISVNENLVK